MSSGKTVKALKIGDRVLRLESDFTLDEAEETHLFARVAQALSKTLCFCSIGS